MNVQPSYASNNKTLRVSPPDITFTIYSNEIGNLPPLGLSVTSDTDVKNIRIFLSDLVPIDKPTPWIPRNRIDITPKEFNITGHDITWLDLKFDLEKYVGSYTGSIILVSDDLTKTVPIKVTISEYVPVVPILLVIIGIISAFLLKIIRRGYGIRALAIEAMDKAEKASSTAHEEKRFGRAFVRADEEWIAAKGLYEQGRYDLSRIRFEKAQELYNKATAETNDLSRRDRNVPQREVLIPEARSRMVDRARTARLVFLGLRGIDGIVLGSSSIVLAIIMLGVLNQLYGVIQTFTSNWSIFIGSFLLGYGSQSALGEAIDWLELGSRRSH